MYGQGIVKGLAVTLKHFFNSYTADLNSGVRKAMGVNEFEFRQGNLTEGIFTVEYPDEKLAVPERFRFVPFLVVENYDDPERPGHDWCTSCGICAKVCPPQCIWIVRGEDPVTKRPIPEPEAFYIDIDICMNCGLCAEFCPFDAIKMDHDYELASYDRTSAHIHDLDRLHKEFRYWVEIAPTTAAEEARDRGGWEHTDIIKEKRKAGIPLRTTPFAEPVTVAGEGASVTETAAEARAAAAAAEESKRAARLERRMAMLSRHRELAQKRGVAP